MFLGITMTLADLKELIPAAFIYRDVTPEEAASVGVDKFYVVQRGTWYLGCDTAQPQLQAKEVL